MLRTKTMSPPEAARFSSSAPCPPGRNSTAPRSSRTRLPAGSMATPSVRGDCSEISNRTLRAGLAVRRSERWRSHSARKPSWWDGLTVMWSRHTPWPSRVSATASCACSMKALRTPAPVQMNGMSPFGHRSYRRPSSPSSVSRIRAVDPGVHPRDSSAGQIARLPDVDQHAQRVGGVGIAAIRRGLDVGDREAAGAIDLEQAAEQPRSRRRRPARNTRAARRARPPHRHRARRHGARATAPTCRRRWSPAGGCRRPAAAPGARPPAARPLRGPAPSNG